MDLKPALVKKRSEQLCSVQPLSSCATGSVNVPYHKSLRHNHT